MFSPRGKQDLVIKFGGTSIGKFPMKICTDIIPRLQEKYNVIVVCSARSTDVKSKGTTSLLMKVTDLDIVHDSSSAASDIVKEILEAHIQAGVEFIKSPETRAKYELTVTGICENIQKLVAASQVIGEIPPRTKDIIIGSGEHLSCVFVSSVLEDNSTPSQVVNFDKVIQKNFDYHNLDKSFYAYLTRQFANAVRETGSRIPIVTGYFGPVPGSMLHSIGRGYTDLTAALIAVGVNASELIIFKEVDGIFNADPRKVPGAKLLDIITPEEASELTYYGSEVVHPFTMEQVMNAMIPIRIKNVQNPLENGTVIAPELMSVPVSRASTSSGRKSTSPTLQNTPEILLRNGYSLDLSRRRPTAVTIKDDIIVISIHSNKKNVAYGFLEKIFSILNKHGIVVDLISTSQVHVSIALSEPSTVNVLNDAVSDLCKVGNVEVIRNMAILSLVGKLMRNMVGISSLLFTTLAQAGVNIEMISQGSNEINISCVINAKSSDIALRAVHKALLSQSGQEHEISPPVADELSKLDFLLDKIDLNNRESYFTTETTAE